MDLDLLPCAGCKKLRVLKLGDYCRDCAIGWPLEDHTYLIVEPKLVGEIMEATGIDGSYLKAKSEQAFEKHCSYVVYYADGEWKDITINDGFHLPTVMKRIFERTRNE